MCWRVYILQCNDDSYYTGITTDLKERVKRHSLGKASQYTKTRRPIKLVYSEQAENKSAARRREVQIKDFNRTKKEQLIKEGFPQP